VYAVSGEKPMEKKKMQNNEVSRRNLNLCAIGQRAAIVRMPGVPRFVRMS
jgi:hypothetical protein